MVEPSEFIQQSKIADVPGFPGVIGTFMGRDALSLAVTCLGLDQSDWVLLPLYTCQEVIRSFIGRTQVAFYDVEPDLTISPDEIRARLGERRVKLMLITNYFGFLQPYRNELKQICAERGVHLIEDCAHSLLTDGSGEAGDLAIYSFRKILPVGDGGGIMMKGQCETSSSVFHPRIYSDALSILARAKSLLHARATVFNRAQMTSKAVKVLGEAMPQNAKRRILPLSRHARTTVGRVSLSEVVAKRRRDFLFWLEVCAKTPSITPIFNSLPAGVCPFGFPVKVMNRNSLEDRARGAGIFLQVHWRLDPRVQIDCSASHELSARLVTLPLYSALQEGDREKLARIVAA